MRAGFWSRATVLSAVMGLVLTVGATTEAAPARGHAPSAPVHLTVGDHERPLNVEGVPRFGWWPADRDGGETQSAYQILVRTEAGRTVWDSGRVGSDQQEYVAYAGPALGFGASYTWTVRTWDSRGERSPWARPASFDTGLRDSDWQAGWIRRTTGERDDYLGT